MWKTAFKYVWVIYCVIALIAVLYTALLPEDVVTASVPHCYSVKNFGKPCFMCGSTRSFMAMGDLKIHRAWAFNKIAVMLWIIIVANSLLILKSLITKLKRI